MAGPRSLGAMGADDDLGFDAGEVPIADVDMDVDLGEVLAAVPAYLRDLLKEFFESEEERDYDEDVEVEDLFDIMEGAAPEDEPEDGRVDVRRMVATTIALVVNTYNMGGRQDKLSGRELASRLDEVAVEARKYDEKAADEVEALAGRVRRAAIAARAVSG